MQACFGLPGFADCTFPLDTSWKQFSFLAEAQRLCGEAFFKGCGLLDVASQLHGAGSFPEGTKAGARDGALITDKCQGPRDDGAVWHVRYRTYGQI